MVGLTANVLVILGNTTSGIKQITELLISGSKNGCLI